MLLCFAKNRSHRESAAWQLGVTLLPQLAMKGNERFFAKNTTADFSPIPLNPRWLFSSHVLLMVREHFILLNTSFGGHVAAATRVNHEMKCPLPILGSEQLPHFSRLA